MIECFKKSLKIRLPGLELASKVSTVLYFGEEQQTYIAAVRLRQLSLETSLQEMLS
jgi:hypothetical protein